ncbi:hypothetical protein PIB30_089596, partial [Stylosanthes scabra]|nr:hypothetical protein [Stylosanthes scabra]
MTEKEFMTFNRTGTEAKHLIPHTKSKQITWHAPPHGWIKCNVDARFLSNSGAGTSAVILRNHQGSIIGGTSTNLAGTSALAAVAMATREALVLAT